MDTQTLEFLVVANGLSFGGMALQAAMLLRMHKSNLRRDLPMFFAYILFSLLQSVVLWCTRNYFGFRTLEYFYAYWLFYIIDIMLAFFVIQEVYARALYRYEGLRSLSRMLFRWAFMILVLVAAIAAMSSPAADVASLYSSILLLNRSAMIVEFGLVVLLFILAGSLALGWRECIFGIAVGMCFYCSLQLAALSLRTHYQNAVADLYTIVKPIISITTLGIWTAYVYRSERARSEVTPFANTNLKEWNAAVLQFLNR